MLKLKLKYSGHLLQTANSLEKSLKLGKTESNRRRGHLRRRWLEDTINTMDKTLGKLREMVKDRKAWHATVDEVAESQIQLGDWTTTSWVLKIG